ncbi:MAG: DEAD/DEAH box helicase, partial [Thaumarchaeota archaeon]|nr:DEAD/DEAH box helicase [Nitrososphaerota archaeon]
TVYGGQSINVQLDALRHGVHTVIGTPGRLIDHIKRGSLNLSSVKFLVLDEADTMLDMGFVEDVEFILESIHGEKQVSLFSATMPPRIIELSDRYMRNPERVLIDSDELSVETLNQSYLVVEPALKYSILLDLLKEERPFSTMIFCRTRYGVRRLARDLGRARFKVVQLHGDLSQHQRDQ